MLRANTSLPHTSKGNGQSVHWSTLVIADVINDILSKCGLNMNALTKHRCSSKLHVIPIALLRLN